ncbi:hypothetical protein B0H19DRAFT_1066730 [Mycena capillaripes]|nr:hypothetical protein B0H19DRAFT_1066730 [Mycena capillaripes]
MAVVRKEEASDHSPIAGTTLRSSADADLKDRSLRLSGGASAWSANASKSPMGQFLAVPNALSARWLGVWNTAPEHPVLVFWCLNISQFSPHSRHNSLKDFPGFAWIIYQNCVYFSINDRLLRTAPDSIAILVFDMLPANLPTGISVPSYGGRRASGKVGMGTSEDRSAEQLGDRVDKRNLSDAAETRRGHEFHAPEPLVDARPAANSEDIKKAHVRWIRIFHPRHHPPVRILSLAACTMGDGEKHSFPAEVALEACKIIANNVSGTLRHLARPEEGPIPADMMMRPGSYLFVTEDGNENYQVVRRFPHWTPPKGGAPHAWRTMNGQLRKIPSNSGSDDSDETDPDPPLSFEKESEASAVVRVLDRHCLVTGSTDGNDAAYLIPKPMHKWKYGNSCRRQLDQPGDETQQVNIEGGHQRANIRKGAFCVLPVPRKWTMIWMEGDSLQLAWQNHMREIKLPERLRNVYVYVRFAWNVFLLADRWLEQAEEELDFVDGDNALDGDFLDDGASEEDEEQVDEGDENEEVEEGEGEGDEDEGEGEEDDEAPPNKSVSRKRKRSKIDTEQKKKAKKRILRPRGSARRAQGASRRSKEGTRTKSQTNKSWDPPDLAPVLTTDRLRTLNEMDEILKAGEIAVGRDADWYPGYSEMAELAEGYRLAHPAATDPGGARVALVSERRED